MKLNQDVCVSAVIFVTVTVLCGAAEAATSSVKASSFGFDPVDSTRFLQVAIDSGVRTWQVDNLGTWGRFQPENPAAGLWRATIRKPSKGFMDDYRIDLSGIPGVMFLSPKKYWK